jgi:hypothetical protein
MIIVVGWGVVSLTPSSGLVIYVVAVGKCIASSRTWITRIYCGELLAGRVLHRIRGSRGQAVLLITAVDLLRHHVM